MQNIFYLFQYPVITKEDFQLFTKNDVEQPLIILEKLNKVKSFFVFYFIFWLVQFQRGTIELLAKMFAYIRRFTIHHDDRLLVYCIIHFLTHRPLTNTTELKTLTLDYDKLRLFLTSEQANYQDKRQESFIERVVNNAGLNHELLEHFRMFFVGVADQFEQK